MPDSWNELSLGEAITLQRGFDLPSYDRGVGNVPIVSSSGPSGTHSEAKVTAPGVVTGRYGTIGQVFYETRDFWPLNTTLYVKDFKGNHPRFIAYLLQIIDFTAHSDKSSVPGVNRNHLHQIRVRVPSLRVQRAISDVLGALDDKIDLNRRMNDTLESMARAIFKSWFVDFDPVRAKAEGRQPAGMDAETAALFPAEFAGGASGPLPTTWRLSRIDQLTSLLNRGITPTYVGDDGFLVLNQKCVRDHRVNMGLGRRHDPSARSVEGRQVALGDVLVNSTGQGTLGRVAQILDLPEQATVDTHVTIVRPNRLQASIHFLGLELIGREIEIEALAEGTTGQTELSRARLGGLTVAVPPMPVQAKFDTIVDPLRAHIIANDGQSATLAALRDTLLPKLLSGEIRIRDAEKAVEAVV